MNHVSAVVKLAITKEMKIIITAPNVGVIIYQDQMKKIRQIVL